MISYSVYKVMHLSGVLMVFLALGGAAMHAISHGPKQHSWRKPLALTHGFGLLLALVGGFGLLARLGFAHGGLPGWAIAKLGIWLCLGGVFGVFIRRPDSARLLWFPILMLGALAAFLAGYKPF